MEVVVIIYLMRHGLDDENYIGGWSDVHLIKQGKEDVLANSDWIKENLEIKQIICSDVMRCKETAEIVNKKIELPIRYTDILKEQNKGILNGMQKEKACENYKDFLDNLDIYSVYPGGESLVNLYKRVQKNLQKIFAEDDNTLMITHRGVINMIYYILLDKEIDMNKEQFNVETASIHELDKKLKKIRRIK